MNIDKEEIQIATLLKNVGLVTSTSEGLRMIAQGAVRIDGNKVEDKGMIINSGVKVYQVGKRRFAKVSVICKKIKGILR